jgi:Fe-S-cluster-containing dehydrogenase component/CRP-like cAMP-binding protein
MSAEPTRIPRPQRWDVPFWDLMTEEEVDGLLAKPPFSAMDPQRFPPAIPLKGILLNDAAVRKFDRGDIIVREGDYGNSAFLIIDGAVRVVLDSLPAEILGRREPQRKNFLQSLAQLWRRRSYPEVRDYSGEQAASGVDAQTVSVRREEGEKTVRIFLQDVPRILDEHHTARLEHGELFGEIAAIMRTPRTATVIAEEPTTLLEIRWQGLREIRKFAPEWKEQIDRLYRERSLALHLLETPLLKGISEGDLQTIADNTRFESFGNIEWNPSYKTLRGAEAEKLLANEPIIAREGDYPNGLILIRSGFARLSRKYNYGEKTIRYLGKGQVFGLEELLCCWKQIGDSSLQYTLRAIGYADVLIIPTPTFERFIAPRFTEAGIARLRERQQSESRFDIERDTEVKLGPDMLEFLVDRRYINGTATMLIDLDRCTRCDDCVRACSAGHDNNPRFIRHGQQRNGIMVANACMHCIDPVCMIGCPTGAIHRESLEGQVVINDLTCIGCATCANSCPYDNIQMVQIRDREGNFIVDGATQTPILKATKCDLCMDQLGGPACVRACPHDALIRTDMRDADKLAEWFNR